MTTLRIIPSKTVLAVRQAAADALAPIAGAAYEAHRGQGHEVCRKAMLDVYNAHVHAVVTVALAAAMDSISPYMDGYTAARDYVATLAAL